MFNEIPTQKPETPLLEQIKEPADLRHFSSDELLRLAHELRHFLLYTVGQTGGHFGAGLGVIELTIALHKVFNTPEDKLIWDVGHQTYPHKILTGRKDQMPQLRRPGGPAPFPSRDESDYDVLGTGHSSTSISAALGLALANHITDVDNHTVVVIGDGAMTAGMAFEALNHVAATQANILIILNDNAMSISENVGGLANYFARNISASELQSTSGEEHIPGSLFTELGLNYTGPIDGHDLPVLLTTLERLKVETGPRLLHVITTKGKGYAPAEASPAASHALTKLEKQGSNEGPAYSHVFGEWLCGTAGKDTRLVAITPAMKDGSGMQQFADLHPDRFHDVAIAEQHAVTLAAGLAIGGAKPVVAIYSTFLQRAYDQLIHDVAIQNLDVLFAVDRASLLEDGPTHSGVFDLSFTRTIPNLIVMTPSDAAELTAMLTFGYDHPAPCLVRYPRGTALPAELTQPIQLGRANVVREGAGVAVMVFGVLLESVKALAIERNYTLINMRFVKPLDEDLVRNVSENHDLLVTIEENAIAGGAGSAVGELLSQSEATRKILHLGVPDEFIEQNDPTVMRESVGLSKEGIADAIDRALYRSPNR